MEEKTLTNPEEDQQPEQQVTEKPGYVPRPVWQVWLARIGLVVFILFLISYYLTLFAGGGG